MSSKRNSRPHREETHLSSEFVLKLRKAEYLDNSLSAGSKNRLLEYRRNLSVSRGIRGANFDKEVIKLLRKYVWNKGQFDEVLDYLFHLTDEDGYRFSRNLKIYSTIEDAMSKFSQPDYTSFRWNSNYQKSLEDLKLRFRKFKLKPLVYYSDDDIRSALPKVNTHSGYYYILSGKKFKGENMEGIHEVFNREMENALETGSFSKPILLGFRTQASGEFEDDGQMTGTCKHKLRVVSMIDLVQIIGELMFAKPYQEILSKMKFYAGGKSETQISSIITDWRVKYARFLSIDYSSFDQTISSWLIEDAFSIIKQAFIMSDDEEKLFDVLVHDFVHKDFILNEGLLHSDRGVPSGSMFTQIIDTLVNILVVSTYFESIQAKEEMIAMGDDNCIFTNESVSIEDLASYISKNFGLIIKTDDKSNAGNTKRQDVKFLSRYWRFDGQWRHPNSLISRLAYPERWRNYSEEVRPEHVIYAFILTYGLGMAQLINTVRFMSDFPISKKYVMDHVDSRYLPGSMAYIREYTYGDTAAAYYAA